MKDTYQNYLQNEILRLLCNRVKFDKESSDSFFSHRSSVAALRFKVGVGTLFQSPKDQSPKDSQTLSQESLI